MDRQSYALNAPDVVYEKFGNEGVLLHLGNGAYYSISGRAKGLLDQILTGADAPALVSAIGAREATAASDATTTLKILEDGDLIVMGRSSPSGDVDAMAAAVLEAGDAFELEAHDDLADMLAADPIHDV